MEHERQDDMMDDEEFKQFKEKKYNGGILLNCKNCGSEPQLEIGVIQDGIRFPFNIKMQCCDTLILNSGVIEGLRISENTYFPVVINGSHALKWIKDACDIILHDWNSKNLCD